MLAMTYQVDSPPQVIDIPPPVQQVTESVREVTPPRVGDVLTSLEVSPQFEERLALFFEKALYALQKVWVFVKWVVDFFLLENDPVREKEKLKDQLDIFIRSEYFLYAKQMLRQTESVAKRSETRVKRKFAELDSNLQERVKVELAERIREIFPTMQQEERENRLQDVLDRPFQFFVKTLPMTSQDESEDTQGAQEIQVMGEALFAVSEQLHKEIER